MTNEYSNILALEKINEYFNECIYSSKYIRIYSNIRIFVSHWCCFLLPKLGSSPEFGVFQEIAQKILCHFKICQKRPKKLPNDTKTLQKAPEIAQNFYIFVRSTQKSTQKAPDFKKKYHRTFLFLSKVPKKAPEKLPNSGEISIWEQLWREGWHREARAGREGCHWT